MKAEWPRVGPRQLRKIQVGAQPRPRPAPRPPARFQESTPGPNLNWQEATLSAAPTLQDKCFVPARRSAFVDWGPGLGPNRPAGAAAAGPADRQQEQP